MNIDLAKTYSQIFHRKKRDRLHTENCTAEQIFYQIRELTDSVIEHAESLLSEMRYCEEDNDRQSLSHDSCSSGEAEGEDSVCEDDVLDCPKKFFEKMDEDVGTRDSSDEVTSDYLADLDTDLEKQKPSKHK